MIPPGFERLLLGHAVAVARSDVAPGIRRMLVSADGTRTTLHEYASRQPDARTFRGRGVAYAVPFPGISGTRVVVRHNRHGGMFRALTGDRFLAPTRAPVELETCLALTRLGIPTPQVIAFALYPPGGIVQRADVCSFEISNGTDLADVLVRGSDDSRMQALHATALLVATMSRAGARHHDLNAKNVLLAGDVAHVLDVDRVSLGTSPEPALKANLARLSRSLRKWRERLRARVSEADIERLNANAYAAFHQAPSIAPVEPARAQESGRR